MCSGVAYEGRLGSKSEPHLSEMSNSNRYHVVVSRPINTMTPLKAKPCISELVSQGNNRSRTCLHIRYNVIGLSENSILVDLCLLHFVDVISLVGFRKVTNAGNNWFTISHHFTPQNQPRNFTM